VLVENNAGRKTEALAMETAEPSGGDFEKESLVSNTPGKRKLRLAKKDKEKDRPANDMPKKQEDEKSQRKMVPKLNIL